VALAKEANVASAIARRHQIVHYSLTVLAVTAAAIATASAHSSPTAAAWSAGAATVLTGILGGLKSGSKATTHWRQRAALGALAQKYENQAQAPLEPSVEIMDVLALQWERIYSLGADEQ
jgi:hypothetical protein